MKTIEEIVKDGTVILNDFADSAEVMCAFGAKHTNENVLFAEYTYEDYEGYAFVLFEKDGKLYEVHGSHCSCYGLENQWEPEEVCLPELVNRVSNGKGVTDYYGGAIRTILGLD